MNSYKMLMGAAALCVSGVATLAAAGPAAAKDVTVRATPIDDVLRTTVQIGDLQLASADGRKALHRRVGTAVLKVCRPQNEGLMSRGYTRCLETAWTGARPQMARAVSAAERLAQTGGSTVALASIDVRASSAR